MSSSVEIILVATEQNNREDGRDAEEKRIRHSTDGYYFLIHFLFLCGLGGLLVYCIYTGDQRRLSKGYDNCKNICGEVNAIKDDEKLVHCEGVNMRERPYLLTFKPDGRNSYKAIYTGKVTLDDAVIDILWNDTARICVVNCNVYPNFEQFRGRCILKNTKEVTDRFYGKSGIPNLFVEVGEDITLCWKTFVYLGIGCVGLSFAIIILFAALTWLVVWLVLNVVILSCAALTIYMWFLMAKTNQNLNNQSENPAALELEKFRSYLAFALIGTFVTPLLIFTVFRNRNRMKAVIKLYEEAIKAIDAIRFLLLQPLLTVMFISTTLSGWMYATVWIESAGNAERPKPQYFIYTKDPGMVVARWYNIFAALWLIRFFLDCQHMVTAGAVSFWYFCRDKNNLGIPIIYGFYNLLAYHVGSVSLGSLITLLSVIPRTILLLMQKHFKEQEENLTTKCCLCWTRWRENILKYFTKDAYIEIVIYGHPFRLAGRRAFEARMANNVDIIAIKEIGNFVLLFANILVCAATVLVGAILLQEYEDLLHIWVMLILLGIFAYLISTCFFSLYQSTVETIFLCFFEDKVSHDGVSKPYYTSKEFFNFLKDSRKWYVDSFNGEVKPNI